MLLKIKEAAKYLCCSVWQLRNVFIPAGLPYIQYGESTSPMLFDTADLDEWIKKHKTQL
jgi:hypothetical protein